MGTSAVLIAAAVSAESQQSAAGTQASGAMSAANTAAGAQLAALGMVQGMEAPYNQAGQAALAQYEQLLGLPVTQGLPGGATNPAATQQPQQQQQQTQPGVNPNPAARGPGAAFSGPNGQPVGTATNYPGSPMGQQAIPGAVAGPGVAGAVPAAGGPVGGGPGFSAGNQNRLTTGNPGGGGQTSAPVAGGQQSLSSFDPSKLPGYQFELSQGLGALSNSAASRGGALSGNTIQGMQQFGQGMATTQFQNYMQQLAGLANMGQAAASGTANLGAGLMSGAGASQASGINAAAMANSAGQIGMGNSLGSMVNSPAFNSMFTRNENPYVPNSTSYGSYGDYGGYGGGGYQPPPQQ